MATTTKNDEKPADQADATKAAAPKEADAVLAEFYETGKVRPGFRIRFQRRVNESVAVVEKVG